MTSVDAARSDRSPVKRGTLRIYLGAAPGVGKSFAMLNEGRRRLERGTDVVVGLVETHGRDRTAEQIGDLEVAPRRTVEHRGATMTEMDVEAILRRRPQVVLVDELAHTNAPGSHHTKRWEDIHDLLAAGIDVISTVNIQHLESLNDVVEGITGIQQRETVPDEVVRAADQIELVDMDPDALRRRLAHGNVYEADRIDAALANYFRAGNLTALRELALLWVADRVDDELADYRARHGISRPWETRERVVVALSGAAGADHLLRRASRIAMRAKGELIGVHVVSDSGLSTDQPTVDVAVQRRLLEELGGEYRKIAGSDVASALVDLARGENATQIVLGASARSRWHELVHGSIINRVVRRSGPIDVHVISPPASGEDEARRLPAMRRVLTPLPPRRQLAGWLIAAFGLPAITLAFLGARDTFGLTSVLLLYLVLAMVVALVGGVFPAAIAVIGGFLLANWFFAPPYGQLDIADAEDALALSVYFVAAGIVAVLVDRIGRSRLRAVRAQAEAETLAALVGTLARPGASRDILDELRMTFGLRGVSLLRRDGDEWRVMLSSGTAVDDPARATWSRELGDGVALALDGEPASAEDLRVLDAFATQVAAAAERDRLRAEAAKAEDLAAANALTGLATAGRVPRSAHAVGVHQGVDIEPPPTRRRLAARCGGGLRGDHRVGDRPPDRPHRQSARHEPPASIGAARRSAANGRGRGRAVGRGQLGRGRPSRRRGRRRRARRVRRSRHARTCFGQRDLERDEVRTGRRQRLGDRRRRSARCAPAGRRAGDRPRAGDPIHRSGARVPAVPASCRSRRRRIRRRPRPGHCARFRRGDGRRGDDRGHAWRRRDDGAQPR